MAAQLILMNGFRARPAVPVQGVGHQLLAGAALAADQNARVGGGGAVDELAELVHGRRGAQDLGAVGELGAQLLHLAPQRRVLEGVADRLQEALAGERLLDEVVDPELERLDGLGDRRLAGDDDGRRQALFLGQLAHQVDAAHPRQTDVEQEQVGRPLGIGELGRAPSADSTARAAQLSSRS